MNSVDRHHHLPGQLDGSDSSDPVDGGATDLANTQSDPGMIGFVDTVTEDAAASLVSLAGVSRAGVSLAGSSSAGSAASSHGSASTGFVIIPTYDSSITSIEFTNPTLYNEFTGAVQSAISYYESLITNSMTIDISFGLGSIGGAAGESGWSFGLYDYSQFYSYMENALDAPGATALQKAAFASLPTSDPTGGTGLFAITGAEQEALGMTASAAAGTVLLSNTLPFSWTQPNSNGSDYDAVGVLEHEISEVMGRGAFLGEVFNSQNTYSLLDFFHYSAAGDAPNAAPGSAPGTLEEPFEAGYNPSVQTYFYDPLSGTITLPYDATGNGDVADWNSSVQNDSYGSAINGETGLVSPTDLAVMNLLGYDELCYLEGTHILTPTGEVLIEDLKIGDPVVTRFNGIQPVKWIGRQSYASCFIKNDREPVRIQAGALGGNTPARDLCISPGHSMLVDGRLVMARSLVNGITITRDSRPNEIHYFQIELENHDCIIAEGAWSETFADGPGLRDQFHNAAEFAQLFPDHSPAAELVLCATRPERGPKLDAALRPLVARTAATVQPGPLRGSIDKVEAPWTIEGWAQDADHPELPVLLEILLGDQVIGSTLACDHRQDLEDARIGRGRCAFFLTSPVRLRPEMLATVRVRRVTDGTEIMMAEPCRARIAAAGKTQASPGLHRVA